LVEAVNGTHADSLLSDTLIALKFSNVDEDTDIMLFNKPDSIPIGSEQMALKINYK